MCIACQENYVTLLRMKRTARLSYLPQLASGSCHNFYVTGLRCCVSHGKCVSSIEEFADRRSSFNSVAVCRS